MMRILRAFRRPSVLLVLWIVAATAILFAAVSDDFNRTDAGNLGANWTDTVNGFDIVSNQARVGATSNAINSSVYTGSGSPTGDQYAQAEVRSMPQLGDGGVIVRGSTSAETFYIFDIGDGNSNQLGLSMPVQILKVVSGSYSQIATAADRVMNVGDILYLEATGTGTVTLTAKVNGSTIGLSTTDSSSPLNSGSPGLFGFQHASDSGSGNYVFFDNFQADSIGGGGGATPCRLLLLGVGCH